MSELLLPIIALPALIALLLLVPSPPVRSAARSLAPWASLPALGLALWTDPDARTDVSWLLLGARLGADATGRVFLLLTALLWTLAGLYARAYLAHDPGRSRFTFFFLLTMSGNLGLTVAQDLATFYFCFVVMTFAAYGLVVHEASARAFRAGRVYIAMAVVGEVMLLAGLLLAAHSAGGSLDLRDVPAGVAGGPRRDLTVALLLGGFGVKAGALPLHVWLPLAHPVAPTPASAVLSGAMIKAGLLGWLRFLPLGEATLPGWGAFVIALGLVAAFYGVAVGAVQDDAKTALAYSSISQMGLITVGIGAGLAEPRAPPLVTTAVVFYALHHGLAKGALFLGVGVASAVPARGWSRRLVALGLLVAALTLAGAPLTSGVAAKSVLKGPAAMAPAPWEQWLAWLLPLSAAGTSLLMGRVLLLALAHDKPGSGHGLGPGLAAPWALTLIAVATIAWLVPGHYALAGVEPLNLAPAHLWSAVWPILLGGLLLWGIHLLGRRRAPALAVHIPPGDVLIAEERALRWCLAFGRTRLWPAVVAVGQGVEAAADGLIPGEAADSMLAKLERGMGRFALAGILLLSLLAALFLTMMGG